MLRSSNSSHASVFPVASRPFERLLLQESVDGGRTCIDVLIELAVEHNRVVHARRAHGDDRPRFARLPSAQPSQTQGTLRNFARAQRFRNRRRHRERILNGPSTAFVKEMKDSRVKRVLLSGACGPSRYYCSVSWQRSVILIGFLLLVVGVGGWRIVRTTNICVAFDRRRRVLNWPIAASDGTGPWVVAMTPPERLLAVLTAEAVHHAGRPLVAPPRRACHSCFVESSKKGLRGLRVPTRSCAWRTMQGARRQVFSTGLPRAPDAIRCARPRRTLLRPVGLGSVLAGARRSDSGVPRTGRHRHLRSIDRVAGARHWRHRCKLRTLVAAACRSRARLHCQRGHRRPGSRTETTGSSSRRNARFLSVGRPGERGVALVGVDHEEFAARLPLPPHAGSCSPHWCSRLCCTSPADEHARRHREGGAVGQQTRRELPSTRSTQLTRRPARARAVVTVRCVRCCNSLSCGGRRRTLGRHVKVPDTLCWLPCAHAAVTSPNPYPPTGSRTPGAIANGVGSIIAPASLAHWKPSPFWNAIAKRRRLGFRDAPPCSRCSRSWRVL